MSLKKIIAVPTPHVRVRRGNQSDADALRHNLLAAAAALFAEGGLENVSMRAVAAQVGVSPMTPYRYFADKAELLTGLWDQAMEAVFVRMQAAFATQADAGAGAGARLIASTDAFIGYWEEHPDRYRLVYMTERSTRREDRATPDVLPMYQDMLEFTARLTHDLAIEIGVPLTHVRMATDIRLTMVLGYLHATLVNRRYPWSDPVAMRAAYLAQILVVTESCLRAEPLTLPGVLASEPRAA